MTQRRHGSSPCVQVRIAHGASSLHQVQLQAVEANQLGRTIRETDMRPNWNAECCPASVGNGESVPPVR
jgi:hypothetical protein